MQADLPLFLCEFLTLVGEIGRRMPRWRQSPIFFVTFPFPCQFCSPWDAYLHTVLCKVISLQCNDRKSQLGSVGLTLLCTLLYSLHLGQVYCIKAVFKHGQSVSNSLFVRSLEVGYDLAEELPLWESVGNSRCIMRHCGVATTLKYNCCARWNLLRRVITHLPR